MICPYCKNDVPDDSIFCPDCGKRIAEAKDSEGEKENKPEPPADTPEYSGNKPEPEGYKPESAGNKPSQPTSPEHKEDFYKEGDILYYSLNPSDAEGGGNSAHWIHGNGCGGNIYVGNNAICVCGRCRKSAEIKYWWPTGEKRQGNGYIIESVEIAPRQQQLQDILRILPVDRAGLKWLNEITSILITK